MSVPFGPVQRGAAELASEKRSPAELGSAQQRNAAELRSAQRESVSVTATSARFKSKQVKSKRSRSALARQSVRTIAAAVVPGMAAAFACAAPAASAMPAAPDNAARAARDAAEAPSAAMRRAVGAHGEAARLRAYEWATTQAGHPYVWGGTGPGYDCSGLVMMSYRHAGINLPRTTYAMLASPLLVRVWRPRMGDLAFY